MKKKRGTKYIFVTGGVVSSLGKGLAAASIARILEGRGFILENDDPGPATRDREAGTPGQSHFTAARRVLDRWGLFKSVDVSGPLANDLVEPLDDELKTSGIVRLLP